MRHFVDDNIGIYNWLFTQAPRLDRFMTQKNYFKSILWYLTSS